MVTAKQNNKNKNKIRTFNVINPPFPAWFRKQAHHGMSLLLNTHRQRRGRGG
jgi:hypothetical protein